MVTSTSEVLHHCNCRYHLRGGAIRTSDVDVTIGCYQDLVRKLKKLEKLFMGQCRTLDADVTIGCYYGDYSSFGNTIPTSFFIWNKLFRSRLLLFLLHVYVIPRGSVTLQ